MTRAAKGARSRRACRGYPERPSKEASDGRFLVGAVSVGGLPVEASAKTGQRRARARARNPTWSAERRASLRRDDKTPRRRSGSPGLRISNAATGDLWCATNARRALLLGPVVR